MGNEMMAERLVFRDLEDGIGMFKRNGLKYAAAVAGLAMALGLGACGGGSDDDVVVLRVANWEEYIDEGDWDEEGQSCKQTDSHQLQDRGLVILDSL